MAVEVVPAIIPESLSHLKEHLARVRGLVSSIQIDIIDGKFAPPKTWPYQVGQDDEFEKIASGEGHLPYGSEFRFELDMMIREPEKVVEKWASTEVGAAIIHIESSNVLSEAMNRVKESGMRLGLALVPSTPNEELYEWISKADFVQLMGNDKIGYHGVELDERVYEKARDLREKYPEITIGVDIGVNFETAPKLVDSGVNKLITGSAIFESRNASEAIKKFQNL